MTSTVTDGAGFVSRSHGAIAPFGLSRPDTVAAAVARLAAGARCHAGGIDVVAGLRSGEAIDELVHLGGIRELQMIETAGRSLRIGATATHHDIETSPVVAAARPDLAAAWRTVGNVRIRRSGTVGGNLLAFDPGYDAAPILAAAGATLHWVDSDGTPATTSVADRRRDGLLIGVEVRADGRVRFDRSLKPFVSVAVGDDAVAIGCAHTDVVVLDRPTSADPADLARWLEALPEPTDDAVASAPYRRRMVGVLVGRLLGGPADDPGEPRS